MVQDLIINKTQELNKYKIDIPPEKMHDALAFASLYFGERRCPPDDTPHPGTVR